MLRDWRFRQALQWAVDREKLAQSCTTAWARPGDTVIPPGYSTDPDWHWTPPASEAYTFDLEKARQLLEAAGYRDANGDGVRDYRGEPIELRLWAMSEYVTSQQEVKLIAEWFRQLGLRVDVATMPMGAMYDRIYNMKDGDLAPDFDICQSGWYLGLDPGPSLSFFTTDQIGNWNDSGFSDAEFDRLYAEQAQTLDKMRRKSLSTACSRSSTSSRRTSSSPTSVTRRPGATSGPAGSRRRGGRQRLVLHRRLLPVRAAIGAAVATRRNQARRAGSRRQHSSPARSCRGGIVLRRRRRPEEE